MKAGLGDVLRGHFHDGTALHAVPEAEWQLRSVLSNLTSLFNTRQETIAHLPSYGLPDPSVVYSGKQESVDQLRRAVQKAVQHYEPRLQDVRVRHHQDADGLLRVMFVITGRLHDGTPVALQTTFASDDLVSVNPWTGRR